VRNTDGEAVMHCARCHGCVVPEQLSDHHGTTERLDALRCLNCGNIEDATIEANRHHPVRRLSSRVPPPPSPVASLVGGSTPQGRPRESTDMMCD
jgi:hypothetical protein